MPPDLPVEIWLEIFQFATYVHQNLSIKPLDPFVTTIKTTNAMGANTPWLAKQTQLALTLVSKSWRRVAVPIFYEHVDIKSPTRANNLHQTLMRSRNRDSTLVDVSPDYGQWVRHVEIYTFARGSGDISYLSTIFQILLCCPNLKMLTGTWRRPLPDQFLNALSKLLGPSLLELSWKEEVYRTDNPTTTPSFMALFQSLRVLDLSHFTIWGSLKFESKPSLPLLEDLIITAQSTSLEASTMFKIPCLRNLTLSINRASRLSWLYGDCQKLLDALLKANGHTLVSVDLKASLTERETDAEYDAAIPARKNNSPDKYITFDPDLCPNLETFVFPAASSLILPGMRHPNIRRIGIRGVTIDGLSHDQKTLATKEHLTSINRIAFPKLELIQTIGFLVEAEGTESIIKERFIWWVEHFEVLGITFIDGESVLWEYYPRESEDQHLLDLPNTKGIPPLDQVGQISPKPEIN